MKNNYISDIYLKIYRKYLISKVIHLILNISLFALLALITIFSVYAIRKNPFPNTKGYYVAISIISAFITLLSSLASLFNLNRKKGFFDRKIKEIDEEYKRYKNNEIEYQENSVLIFENINKIMEEID